ncbi:integrase, catalytic region, zinc finger, CCHC-type containing protein [Tanacetum coccineum]
MSNLNNSMASLGNNASRTANILEQRALIGTVNVTGEMNQIATNSWLWRSGFKELIAFRKSTCYICDLKGNDLLIGSRGTDLYSITLQDSTTPNPICLMVKATSSQAWSKEETPGVLINFLPHVQRGLHAQVTTVRTDKGTEFLNKTLHAYFAKEGIRHEMSTARIPKQNGVVEKKTDRYSC